MDFLDAIKALQDAQAAVGDRIDAVINEALQTAGDGSMTLAQKDAATHLQLATAADAAEASWKSVATQIRSAPGAAD